MKNIQNKFLLLLLFVLPNLATAQSDAKKELRYEVNKVYPFIYISKEELNEAESLMDLNPHYRPSWVKKYVSVEVLTSSKGKEKKARNKDVILSEKQKSLIKSADVATTITVKVLYFPDNTLKKNDVKEHSFSFVVAPKNEASYAGGEEQLNQYLRAHAIDKISNANFDEKELAAVKFAINKEGQVVDAHVFQSSKNEKTDQLLLETVSNMKDWKPAEYVGGVKAKQEFVLTVGNMESCVINLLNIRQH